MDYSLKDAFKSLKDIKDDVELKHQKVLKEDLETDIKEGYIGQTVRDFLEDCIEASTITKIQIADNDADDFTVAFEGSFEDIPEELLEGSFDDFDTGDTKIVINVSEDEEDYQSSTYYETVAAFLDDYNGDEIEIQGNNAEILFSGDRNDIPEELLEANFVSYDAPEFICINARELGDYKAYEASEKPADNEIKEEILDEDGDRINLKRYGFVRAPEEDFRDDGTSFTCYWYDPKHEGDKRFRCSKAVSDGDAYINVRYSAPNGRSKHFDSLNGVSISTAAAGIPDLVKEIEEFKNNEIETFSEVRNLTADEVKDVAEEVRFLMDRAGLTQSQATTRAYQNKNISYDNVPYTERKKVEDALRNTSPYDREEVEKTVKSMIKSVIHDLSDHSRTYDGRQWIKVPAKSIDDAISSNSYSIRKYPDSIQEKIKKHIKEKLEALYNFKAEALEEKNIDNIDVDAMAAEVVDEVENELKNSLNESWVNLNDEQKVKEEKEAQEKEKNEEPIMQIVDPAATIVDELKDDYLGYAALLCVDCKTALFKKPEELEKTESVDPDTGETKILYNVGFECPHCGSKHGYDLKGQIAALNIGGDPVEEEKPEPEEPEEEKTTPAPELEVKDKDDEVEDEIVVGEGLTDFDEVSFDKHINKYLKETYNNVDSYESTDGSIEGSTIIIEGLIKFTNGKENKTSFKLTLNGTQQLSGLNESFAKEENSYSIEGRVENNTFITENINYKYKIEEDLIEGCTKEIDEEKKDLTFEDAIKIADDEVLDDEFGKDTPERKLVGAIKGQPKDKEKPLDEAKNNHEFEVGWFEGLTEEEAKQGDPIFKNFTTKKDALDYHELIKDDEGKFGFFIKEWDENGELVDNIL